VCASPMCTSYSLASGSHLLALSLSGEEEGRTDRSPECLLSFFGAIAGVWTSSLLAAPAAIILARWSSKAPLEGGWPVRVGLVA